MKKKEKKLVNIKGREEEKQKSVEMVAKDTMEVKEGRKR